MKRLGRDVTIPELAMRALLITQRHAQRPDFLMGDISQELVDRFGINRATGFRYARTALDVMGIHYDAYAPCRFERRAANAAHRWPK